MYNTVLLMLFSVRRGLLGRRPNPDWLHRNAFQLVVVGTYIFVNDMNKREFCFKDQYEVFSHAIYRSITSSNKTFMFTLEYILPLGINTVSVIII